MAAMDLLLGPILLGTIVNILLYGIMITQTTIYYVSFPRDHRWIKLLVAYMFTIDTLNSIFDIGLVWKYTITLFGDYQKIQVSSWWFNVEPVMTVMISSATQCFFAWRVAKLTGHAWMGWGIAFSALVQFIAGLATAVGTFIVRDFARFLELRVPVTIWLVLSAVTDIVITCILSWYLHTNRTGFSKTDDIITRLVRLTVQTGLITTVWATTDLLVYLCWPNNMYAFVLPVTFMQIICELTHVNLERSCWMGWKLQQFGRSRKPDVRRYGTGQLDCKDPAVWRPDQTKSQPTTVVQVVTTETIHRDDGFELEEYGFDVKRMPSGDIEALGEAQSKVQLPDEVSDSAIPDGTSVDSRASFGTK
ncbi:unnamed protein product [Rhizoctonia solani]|uniref:DUF6534 domain-containing protein n=1 Tax=Rhizoctonia solani TaxID=456999 RepID=A0A8H2X0Q8_9AGAM|nr:unnamed protein product [Rhizoctonia solani]